jgi:hypothetical protein
MANVTEMNLAISERVAEAAKKNHFGESDDLIELPGSSVVLLGVWSARPYITICLATPGCGPYSSGDQGESPGSGDVIHYLTVGHLDPEALRECGAVATRPLDETTVRRVLAEFPRIKAERKDGHVILPWHGLGPVGTSEAFALRLHELTGCLIADRRNGRLIEPEALSQKQKAAPQELSPANRQI